MQGGVGKKIRSQIQFWQKDEREVHLFVLSPDEIHVENCTAFHYSPTTNIPGIQGLSRTISRSRAGQQLFDDVRNYRPDLIYMRFGRYVSPIDKLSRIAPILLELNTDDINENKHLGWLQYIINLLTRGRMLTAAAGLIAVSQEIADLPANRSYAKPTIVIANGIDLTKYAVLPPSGNTRPVITFVGSPGMIWHGVDKLVRLAEKCPDLEVNIVGYHHSDADLDVPTNVQFHGFLDSAGIRKILMKTDAACGSLALHRNHMMEASPLKVREALAYGVPLLLGYKDTDLSNLESEYILQIPNTEDNVLVHAEQIHSFTYNMMGKRVSREFSAAHIDQGPKEEKRLAFFDETVRNHLIKLKP